MLDRRDLLGHLGTGLGGIALASLLAEGAPIRPRIDPAAPLAPRTPHFPAKARRVLHVFCSGACSHLDTFDYKPALIKRHGQSMGKVVTFQGENGAIARSPYEFRPRGACGKMTSDLLPLTGALVDHLCFIHSMTAKANTHGPAESQMNTGFTLEGHPSMGAWAAYALGSEARDLPAFVAIPDPRGIPQIGPANWSAAFLPAVFQGTSFNASEPIRNLAPPKGTEAGEKDTLAFLRTLNRKHLEARAGDTDLAARIAAYELAGRMQLSAPEVSDLGREPRRIRELYGCDDKNPLLAGFARNCLLARRLLEKGVRFVQLFNGAYAMGEGVGNWDGHKQLKVDY
ncbi:MAG: DUF1501 domain-containing protein, partial [Gemmataceae bacterium]|nr:DUF1501 domain-containing protein [Gemmataceae bacterium]